MKSTNSIRQQIQVCVGKAGISVGNLVYVKQGHRENTTFSYHDSWLAHPDKFNISADLYLSIGYQSRKAPSSHDSVCNGQKNQAGLAFSNTARSLCNSACNSASEGKNAR